MSCKPNPFWTKNPRYGSLILPRRGHPFGALGAAQIVASADGYTIASTAKRLVLGTFAALTLNIAFGLPSFALEVRDLRPGIYVERPSGCQAVGSAAAMSFDGRNFSGHYQMCRTDQLGGSRIRNVCIEAQGPNWPDPKEIDTDPDRTTSEAIVTVQSPTSFTLSGKQYRHCGG